MDTPEAALRRAGGQIISVGPCLRLADWLTRDLPEPDYLLGHWLSTTGRVLMVGETGRGKTTFGVALATATSAGRDFLHWQASRVARVLYIDGEMSRGLMKRRLRDAVRRIGCEPNTLFVLCQDDFEAMPPLNTPEGQAFIEQHIEQIGGVDLIIFDNVQALLAGDMREEQPWSDVLPWIRALTKRSIGQIWIHHTGHDTGKSYGTKTREWQLDTVILLEAVERFGADIAFTLRFTKARERMPETRGDFEPVTITLAADVWSIELEAPGLSGQREPRVTGGNLVALDMLRRAIDEVGEIPPTNIHIPPNRRAVRLETWRRFYYQGAASDDTTQDAKRKAFKRAITALQAAHEIAACDEWIWTVGR